MMKEVRRIITVDNHEAGKIGDLDKHIISRAVVKPNFTAGFFVTEVRERADELTLRKDKGTVRFSNVLMEGNGKHAEQI